VIGQDRPDVAIEIEARWCGQGGVAEDGQHEDQRCAHNGVAWANFAYGSHAFREDAPRLRQTPQALKAYSAGAGGVGCAEGAQQTSPGQRPGSLVPQFLPAL
jgi:hypothetical protein